MDKVESLENGEVTNTNIENSDKANNEGNDEVNNTDKSTDKGESNDLDSNNNEESDKIKNLINSYKTPELLAKAKINSDREYSKIKSEKDAIESLFKDKIYQKDKKYLEKDNSYILELLSEDPEYATKISKEVLGKDIDVVLKEFEDSILNGVEDLTGLFGNEFEGNKTLTKKDLEKIIEIKANQKKLELLNEENNKNSKIAVEKTIKDFLNEKGLTDERTKEFKEFNDLFTDLSKGRDNNIEDIKKILKIAFNTFSIENSEFNNKVKEKIEKLNNSSIQNSQGVSGKDIGFNEEDLRIAKKINMSIEKYMELKNKYFK